MKKTIFAVLVVLLLIMAVTCDNFAPKEDIDDTPSVQYSANGKSITLRLDGGGTDKKVDRALTDALAKMGHDYFEVVFDSGTTLTRTSWELGEAATIKNVERGFNYDDATKAILFAGRRADKTVLGVGLLTATDTGGTTITAATKTATFTVAALTSSVSFPATGSSFLTNAKDTANAANSTDTDVIEFKTSDTYTFPMFLLPKGSSALKASYEIGCSGTIASYTTGIKVKTGAKAIISTPAYLSGSVRKGISPYIENPITVTFTSNNAAADFDPITTMNITTPAKDGLCMLAFQIPVFALNDTVTAGSPNAIDWFIKPGFGPNLYLLDNGDDNAGGSVLLGIGEIDSIELIILP